MQVSPPSFGSSKPTTTPSPVRFYTVSANVRCSRFFEFSMDIKAKLTITPPFITRSSLRDVP